MKILSLISPKGGTGKSTLTCNLSAMATGKVLILDADPQATALSWYNAREGESPQLACVNSAELQEAVSRARHSAYEWVFIDTAGRDDPGPTLSL